jgi:molybdate transport system substrate-binding protein
MSRLPPPALVLSAVLALQCKSERPPAPEPIRVAAAADLTLAFEELGRLFESRTGQQVSFSFGASGALAEQLGHGAPFDVFAAANAAFVDRAVGTGACDGASKQAYARGHLTLWSKGSLPRLASLADLTRSEVERIAIANPEHAPYGHAAREALERAGLWARVQDKIVFAENVRQALQFAETGNADVAIVARSLLLGKAQGQSLDLEPSLYSPLEQTLVICRHGKRAAGGRAFAQLVESPEGQALLTRYGFDPR